MEWDYHAEYFPPGISEPIYRIVTVERIDGANFRSAPRYARILVAAYLLWKLITAPRESRVGAYTSAGNGGANYTLTVFGIVIMCGNSRRIFARVAKLYEPAKYNETLYIARLGANSKSHSPRLEIVKSRRLSLLAPVCVRVCLSMRTRREYASPMHAFRLRAER